MNNNPRLNQQLIDLQQEVDIATGKLHKVREALILETRIEEKLRIEYQVELTEQTLDQLNQRYDKLEEYLSSIGLKELPNADENPYKSLAAFQEKDAEQFFGREIFVQELVEKYQQVNLLPLLGPSGSGKSSVARAGLIPELKKIEKNLQTIIITPTDVPLENLANHLAWLITHDPFPIAKTREFEEFLLKETDALKRIVRGFTSSTNQKLVILIDQFEEIYTLCKDKNLQTAFIENILTLNEEQHLSAKVILTLRSDFLGETQQHSKLNQLIARQSIIVPAMNENELRDAISKPAELAGHPLDEATINLLLEQTEGRASALPLLQFALTQIWDNMSKGISAAQTLSECGGVGGALAKKAEEVFTQLTDEDQKVTRRIFLKLVQLGEGSKDTRRRTPLSEMIAQHDESAEKVKLILERFARQDVRLLSLATQAVENNNIFAEITHESLLDNWQLLQEWLKDGREAERFHRRVHEAAQLWQLNQRPSGSLWRSPDLDLLATFYSSHSEDMTALEIDFFNSSREQQQREINEKLKQQRRLKLLTSVALLIAIVAGFFYFQAEQQTEIALQNENEAKSQTKIAEEQKKLALDNENKAKEQAMLAQENAEKAREQETIAQNNAQQALKEKQNAIEQRNEALKTQSLFLADLSSQELKNGNSTLAILLTLEGLPTPWSYIEERPFVQQAADGLLNAVTIPLFREKFIFDHEYAVVFHTCFSSDAQQILTVSQGNNIKEKVKLWDKQTGNLLRTFNYEEDIVWSAHFSPDNQQIVVISSKELTSPNKVATLWDKQTGEIVHTFQDMRNDNFFITGIASLLNSDVQINLNPHEQVSFSPDGQQILVTFNDNTAKIWDKSKRKFLHSFQHEKINKAFFSPDGQQVVTISIDKIAKLWDKQRKVISSFQQVNDVSFSPDNKQILIGFTDGSVSLLERKTAKNLYSLEHEKSVKNVKFSPDGYQILVVLADKTANLWDKQTRTLLRTFQQVNEAFFSPDSQQILASLEGGIVVLWDKKTGNLLQIFEDEKTVIKADFSPDGQHIFIASTDGFAKLWSKQYNFSFQHEKEVKNAFFSPDDQQILTIEDKTLHLWDKQTGKHLQQFQHEKEIQTARFSPDSQQLLTTAFFDNAAKLWDKQTGKLLTVFPYKDMPLNLVFNANFSPNGQQIITAGNKEAKLWDKQTGKILRGFPHEQAVINANFSFDDKQIITASASNAILWNKQTGELIRTFPHADIVLNANFSPDNQQILTVSSNVVTLWDKQTGNPLETFVHADQVQNANFNPNGWQILTISNDKTAKLWDKQTGQLVRVFSNEQLTLSANFSPNGEQIITTLDNKTAKLWNVHVDFQTLINDTLKQLPIINNGKQPPYYRVFTCEERQRFFLFLPKKCIPVSQSTETN